jgi:dipeptidyl aminopeptidase/acylaminoacyl peptidase
MAYIAPFNKVLNVWMRSISSQDDKPVTKDADRGVRTYLWSYDNNRILYLQDSGGNENFHLYSTDLESLNSTDLTPFENIQVRILEHVKQFPNEILLSINKNDPRIHDVYKLTFDTGILELVCKNPGNVVGWEADYNLQIRAATCARSDGGFDLLVRDTEESEWRPMITWDAEDALTTHPLSFTKDGFGLYLIDSRNSNTGRLIKLDILSNNFEVIAEDPVYDVSRVMINPNNYEIQAVSFNRARNDWLVLDPSIKLDFQYINNLDNGDFSIYSRDIADKTWMVGFTKDTGPVSFYTYNRQSQKGEFLFEHQPKLTQYRLANMQPVSFKARDGLTINGYLTFPPKETKLKLPMVLNVHGGPWARDSWGFDPSGQWLANRGYLCFQVNFRGSTGYGKAFVNAGDREWGGKMHDDLVDAIDWAIKEGYADQSRIAIFGGSYGGYAALVGATFTPNLFQCAVDIVGPSNLITLIKSVPPYWEPMIATFHKRVGHPEKDAHFLKSRSPLFKVDRIKIPILIAQGANDPRVKQAESEQIVEAMKKKGLPYKYLVFPDEGHGFAKPENRLKFFQAAEEFLAQYL